MNTDDNDLRANPEIPDLWLAWMRWIESLLINNAMPLSGNVSQWIEVWGRAVGQIGLLNVNLENSANPAAERAINRDYSYGRQLGRILDVLHPIVEDRKDSLRKGRPEMQAKLEEFLEMVEDIERKKKARRIGVPQMLATLKAMRQDCSEHQRPSIDAAIRALAPLQMQSDRH